MQSKEQPLPEITLKYFSMQEGYAYTEFCTDLHERDYQTLTE